MTIKHKKSSIKTGIKTGITSSTKLVLDYSEDIVQDEFLRDIKLYCLDYIMNTSKHEQKSFDELMHIQEFLADNFKKYTKLKKSLRLKTHSWSITEISQLMDEMTLSETIHDKTVESYNNLICKELSHILETICFCYGIINMKLSEY